MDEARRLRGVEGENGRLKRLAADQAVQFSLGVLRDCWRRSRAD